MLHNPTQLSTNSTTVRRFKNLLTKEFERQALNSKWVQTIRIPVNNRAWLRNLFADPQEMQYVQHVLNTTSLVGSGWQIEDMSKGETRAWAGWAGGEPVLVIALRWRGFEDGRLNMAAK